MHQEVKETFYKSSLKAQLEFLKYLKNLKLKIFYFSFDQLKFIQIYPQVH